MDQLGGIDFRKGCYVGQEVVSRMQHRGTARTRLLAVEYPEAPAAPGSEIQAGAKVLGTTGSTAAGKGLALVRLDRLGDALAVGEPLRADGKPLAVARPSYATFPMPDAGGEAAV
jgi:folate-binding Fe-S cluster repair protein YgfZ